MLPWDYWRTFRLLRNSIEFVWFSYSVPTPRSARQIFTLLLMCLAISVSTAALLFHWLMDLLLYDPLTADISAGIYGTAVFILSFLVHPFRCAFTLMFPTMGTRQGRKLVLSMCAMLVVLHILPNIAANIATITHLVKCTTENLARSLLSSAALSNKIKSDIVGKVQTIKNNEFHFVERLSNFNHSTDIKVSELRESLNNLSKHVEEDFSKAKQQLEEWKLLSSRIFAAIFVVYLFMDSTIYLKSYLTSVRFDNVYITGLLRKTANDRGIQVEAKDVKNGVNSTSFRMTKRELIRCLVPILQITLYLLMTVMLIMLDHIVFYLVATSESWLLDIPSTDITIQAYFTVDYQYCPFFSCFDHTKMVNLRKMYSAIISPDAAQCKAKPSMLNPSVLVSLGLLYLLSYCLAFLEVYARRLRRKVASSFFQQQEKERIKFLIEKILNKKMYPKSLSSTEAETGSVEKEMQGNDEVESRDQSQCQSYKFYNLHETSTV
ncbi:osteoclast stimulatory transmembrane protein isoform X2 [Colossoma macropomum]|uniref:osteoclast stimulatory transmembrane protein isoform X2 n=1 Tax=Colossoma macropomum TaxID=42526 RepID=UPI001865674C|nr:osteoclast stimulatory transmembrane protein isoform X2 [Colossoma macropomum]